MLATDRVSACRVTLSSTAARHTGHVALAPFNIARCTSLVKHVLWKMCLHEVVMVAAASEGSTCSWQMGQKAACPHSLERQYQ